MTTLVKYPVDSKRELFVLPASVEDFSDYPFVFIDLGLGIYYDYDLPVDSETFSDLYKKPEYLTVHVDSTDAFAPDSFSYVFSGPAHVCIGDATKAEIKEFNDYFDEVIAEMEAEWQEYEQELTPGTMEYYAAKAEIFGMIALVSNGIDCENDHTRLHKYAEVVEVIENDCTTDGYTAYECVCGYEFKDTMVAPGHKYSHTETKVICTTNGYTTHVCSVCNDTYTDSVIKAEGHKYESVVTEPTCTKKGYTTHICSVCDDTYTDAETAATGHSHSGKVTKAPTCEMSRTETFTCHCGNSYTNVIKA